MSKICAETGLSAAESDMLGTVMRDGHSVTPEKLGFSRVNSFPHLGFGIVDGGALRQTLRTVE